MSNKLAANSGLIMALVLVVVIIAVIYLEMNGTFNLGGGGNNGTPTAYTTTVAIESSSVLSGHSTNLIFTYFNPFPQAITPNVSVSVGNPTYVSVASPAWQTVSMPASMQTPVSVDFNITCKSSNELSTSQFSVSLNGFWQNASTSVETYPYGTSPLQTLPLQVAGGFMSIVANPITIETGGSLPTTQALTLQVAPVIYNGEPFVGTTSGEISEVIISISNSTGGIASAFVTYKGVQENFGGSSMLTLTIPDYNPSLEPSGLSIEVSPTNKASPTQNVVAIDTLYNYAYSLSGPSINCQ
jgi:hypothetical protein